MIVQAIGSSVTDESHTGREFLDEAFSYVELDWQDHMCIDPRFNGWHRWESPVVSMEIT